MPIKTDTSAWTTIRNRILAGLFVVVPIGISLWLGYFIFTKLTEWSVQLIGEVFRELGEMNFYGSSLLRLFSTFVNDFWFLTLVRIFSLLVILGILFLIGELAKWTFGRRLIATTELIMMKVPMLNSVYSTTRQIGEALWSPHGGMFRQVVLFEYPRKGIWVIGFLTNENQAEWELGKRTDRKLISIFLPTTPNPTSGFLLFLPREDCVFLDMDIAEGMRLVISGGAVQPLLKKLNISGDVENHESSFSGSNEGT